MRDKIAGSIEFIVGKAEPTQVENNNLIGTTQQVTFNTVLINEEKHQYYKIMR